MLIAAILIFLIAQTKNIILLMIFLYQKFAPKAIRAACLFTPSCSEYMRISVQKYGVLKGVKKGFRRLRRCRPPNGGLDEP
ncbi:MAG: membrane protein insertion efficiency factor YidD [Ruminococcus sp.]|nr:membrane protein insertion efficiency factor YidD [Ruminococcus sp.]